MSTLPFPATPYIGLVPYSEEDAAFFFGREVEQEIITANLVASRLTLLYGSSGVGKSSVLRAGVAQPLRQFGRRNLEQHGSPEFVVAVFNSWRDDPVRGLMKRVKESIELSVDGRQLQLPTASHSLTETLLNWTKHISCNLFVILDQFEEYFLYSPAESGKGTFAVEFPRAVTEPQLRVNFLVSIREDALAKLDRFEGSIPILFDNYLRIEHLDRKAARRAIKKPLEVYNQGVAPKQQRVRIEPALVRAVLESVKTDQVFLGETGRGVLEVKKSAPVQIETPYLQLVMTRLWKKEVEEEGSHTLRLATFTELGGAKRIVRTYLDGVISALSANEKRIAARVFHYLVTPSGTKIAYIASDLAALAKQDETEFAKLDEGKLKRVLEKLCDVRILRSVDPSPSAPGEPRYEIFLDVLASPILDWRARFREEKKREKSRARLAERRAEAERWKQAHDSARRAQRKAFAEQKLAMSRELAASAITQLRIDPELSVLLAVKAVRIKQSAQAKDALRQALLESRVRGAMRGHKGPVSSVALSPTGKYVATASWDNTVRIWNVATGRVAKVIRTNLVSSANYSPDGKLIVTAHSDHVARVWDAANGKLIAELLGHSKALTSATFHPNGKSVVTASADGTARVWKTATWKPIATIRGHNASVNRASYSPSGKLIVTASTDGTTRVWHAATGRSARKVFEHGTEVYSSVFSPDGKLIVTASLKSVRLWRLSKKKMVIEFMALLGKRSGAVDAVFSPDGKLIATADLDGTARVWETSKGRMVFELRGHTRNVSSIAFDADGKFVITASLDGTARLWEAGSEKCPIELVGHTDAVSGVAFSPDNRLVATASLDNTARIWKTSTWRTKLKLEGHTEALHNISFSPDGKFVVTSSRDTTARVWRVANGNKVALLAGHSNFVFGASFSPDGTIVVTGSYDSTACLWDAKTGKLVGEPLRHPQPIFDVVFSPNGKLLATTGGEGTVWLWELATKRILRVLLGHQSLVRRAAFSNDGKFLVTASGDKTARVYRVSTGKLVALLSGHTGPVNSASFSPNGKLVLTVSWDGTARVWEVRSKSTLAELRGHAGAVNSAAFSSDGKSIITGGDDHTARVQTHEIHAIEDLLKIASKRATRELTPEELQMYALGS